MVASGDRYQNLMSQGHSAAWDQDWDRALGFYRQVVGENPEDVKALTSMALALFELHEHEESLRMYLQIISLSPEDPVPQEKAATLYQTLGKGEYAVEIFVRAAELYLHNKDVEKAIENWGRAVNLDPGHLRARSRLALVFERLKRRPQAVQEYLHIASLMQHAGDIGKAAQAVNRALTILPDNDEAVDALIKLRDGVLLPKPEHSPGIRKVVGTPQLRTATESDDAGSGLDPIEEALQEALSILASSFFDQGAEDEEPSVRSDFHAIVEGSSPSVHKETDYGRIMLHLSQAVDYQTRGNLPEAAQELERAIDTGLENIAAYYDLGYLRSETERWESAIRHLQRSVRHNKFALGSRLLLGRIRRKMGRLNEAAIEYLDALKIADSLVVSPQEAAGLRQLYEPIIEERSKDTDEEKNDDLCNSIDELLVRPNWQEHLDSVRKQLLPAHNGGPPAPMAEILTETHSGQVVSAITAVRSLSSEGRSLAAMEEAFFALQYAPTYLPLHIAIGELLLEQNHLQEAVDKFMVVSRSYSVRGESSRAIDLLSRVVEMAPLDLGARNQLIEQLTDGGEVEKAIDEYLSLADIHYHMADLVKSRKTYSQALRLAQQTDVGPDWNVRILHQIADIDIQSLDWRQALRVFDRICSIKPDDIKACSNLVDLNLRLGQRDQALKELDKFIIYLSKDKRNDEVIEFLEKLVVERPQQAGIQNRLARQYYIVGQDQQAVKQFNIAAEILLEAGDRAGAVENLQNIIRINPPDVEDYQEKLERLS
jgi:tetratricopeptide (TPR) repeat protein